MPSKIDIVIVPRLLLRYRYSRSVCGLRLVRALVAGELSPHLRGRHCGGCSAFNKADNIQSTSSHTRHEHCQYGLPDAVSIPPFSESPCRSKRPRLAFFRGSSHQGVRIPAEQYSPVEHIVTPLPPHNVPRSHILPCSVAIHTGTGSHELVNSMPCPNLGFSRSSTPATKL